MVAVGRALVEGLKARGVSVVFGIPGVHTVELYRALSGSGLRHVTVRHEQAAGFAADGFARVAGRAGVAFVITGPGATNALTPMAQARADSVPILVISGVNPRAVQGRGLGHLHELPDQLATMASVALHAEEVASGADLAPALDRCFAAMAGRGGPVHLQMPLDVMAAEAGPQAAPAVPPAGPPGPPLPDLARARALLAGAARPVILAGGGAKRAGGALRVLAEALDAPVVMTTNARGLLHGHPLGVPASASLRAVRGLIAAADQVLAVGTELGPTDYDMYGRGGLPDLSGMIRIDADADQLARHLAAVTLQGDAATLLAALAEGLVPRAGDGAARAEATRRAAWDEIGPGYRAMVVMLDALRGALPGAIVVGDSTQPVYAGNLYYDHDRPGGWFNAATGYGALGYGAPVAIGAALAAPDTPVVCLTGDGGLQFSLAELMTARDEGVDVTFVVWNNHGYGEIAEAMAAVGAEVLGCDPTPPDFADLARACGLPHQRITADPAALAQALMQTRATRGPAMIEVIAG